MTDTQKAAQKAVKKVKAKTVIYETHRIELMDKNKHEILSAEKKMTEAVEEMIRKLREHETKMKANLTEIYQAQQKHQAIRMENFELK